VIATVGFVSPFQVLGRQMTLKPKDRKLPELGPEVSVAAVRLGSAADEPRLKALIQRAGLRKRGKNAMMEHDTNPSHMWLGNCATNLSLEFELAQAAPLGAIEVWNFNVDCQTTEGVHQADVAISADGTTWQTVLRNAEFSEAEGADNYDTPAILNLKGIVAKKVRLENLRPWGGTSKVGLSKVIFHRSTD
jgi:hypothetical protein